VKFSDGYWRIREDVRMARPAEVHDVTATSDTLTVHAPTRRITGRGDTLNTPLLTFELWSPAADVIGVRMTHRAGAPAATPAFAVGTDPAAAVDVGVDDHHAVLRSGRLSVQVASGAPWRLAFTGDGRALTTAEARGTGFAEMPDGSHRVLAQLGLGVDEWVYGLGERFGPFVKNGQVVDIWNDDGGTSSWKAYKNVPFYLTNQGYGVFVNHPGAVSFEVGSETVSQVQFSVEDQALEYFVIYGPTPKEILTRHTALTGRPALPPAWSFGLWLTTSFTTSYDEATVTRFIQGMDDRDIPLRVFHFDCFWMREFNWCDFEWDRRAFPDPQAMLKRLAARDLAISVWIKPLHRPALAVVRRGPGQRLPAQAPGRHGLADRQLAGGHGHRRLHQPRRLPLVPGQAARPPRHGGRLLQDRLRREDPHRCRLVRWLRSPAHAQLLHLPVQPHRVRGHPR
jgi:alpha-D-xyloside xylohydrolase